MPRNPFKGRVLAIGGSDSGAGAGIQADLKTITALGGYGMTAITTLTAQNTHGIFGMHAVPEAFIADQIKLVLNDIGADAIKTGMLYEAGTIKLLAGILVAYPGIPLIIDPVMAAKDGSALLKEEALTSLKELLIPRALLLTPNVPEAKLLTGIQIATVENMKTAGEILLKLGCSAVLIKGGHMKGEIVTDMLIEAGRGVLMFSSPRINTPHTHGTGCTLASAIATGIAMGMELEKAVAHAHAYVQSAIANAPGLGGGHGPLGIGQVNPPVSA